MIVNCALYGGGRRLRDLDLGEIRGALEADPSGFVWLGLWEPSEELLGEVQAQFGLHDLAIEDAHQAHQRPKLEEYEESLFVVLHTMGLDAETRRLAVGETHLFVGPNYVVSVRHGPSLPYSELRRRCETRPSLLELGPGFVLYSLMDFVVDHYFPVADELEEALEEVEEAALEDVLDRKARARIHHLRRDLLTFRHASSPIVEITNRAMRADPALVPPTLHPYFRDIADHVLRLNETIDNLREILVGAVDANLSLVSMRQNQAMRRLAGWAAIIAVPTLIASIWGMNFEGMPGIHARNAHWVAIGGMAAAAVALYTAFRRTRWL